MIRRKIAKIACLCALVCIGNITTAFADTLNYKVSNYSEYADNKLELLSTDKIYESLYQYYNSNSININMWYPTLDKKSLILSLSNNKSCVMSLSDYSIIRSFNNGLSSTMLKDGEFMFNDYSTNKALSVEDGTIREHDSKTMYDTLIREVTESLGYDSTKVQISTSNRTNYNYGNPRGEYKIPMNIDYDSTGYDSYQSLRIVEGVGTIIQLCYNDLIKYNLTMHDIKGLTDIQVGKRFNADGETYVLLPLNSTTSDKLKALSNKETTFIINEIGLYKVTDVSYELESAYNIAYWIDNEEKIARDVTILSSDDLDMIHSTFGAKSTYCSTYKNRFISTGNFEDAGTFIYTIDGTKLSVDKVLSSDDFKSRPCYATFSELESCAAYNYTKDYTSFSVLQVEDNGEVKLYRNESLRDYFNMPTDTDLTSMQTTLIDLNNKDKTLSFKTNDGRVNIATTYAKHYNVVFKDTDGSILKECTVYNGESAIAPEINNNLFIGWDKDFSNVTEDIEVVAQYKKPNLESFKIDIDKNQFNLQ